MSALRTEADADSGGEPHTVEKTSDSRPAAATFGRERFLILRKRWLTPNPNTQPLPVDPDQLDEDEILDAVANCPGDELVPPVHFPYMAEALSLLWEEEGLYN